MSDFDVVVAGGGPAGVAAAITAARAGTRVLLAERGHYPRQKVCGEFISSESLDLLRSLLSRSPEALDTLDRAPRIDRARVFVGEQRFDAPITPAAASLARYDLDALLWSAAERAGVDARQNLEVISFGTFSPGQRRLVRVRMGEAEEMIPARVMVQAAGRSSRLAPAAAGDKWIGLKAHFRSAPEHARVTTDLYCFAGGYCGVQPVRCGDETLLNACALVRPERARTMEEVLACDAHLWKASRAWEHMCDTVTTGAVAFRKPQTERDGAFLAGDAAGFIDPFVGDGIAIALRGGSIAGEIATQVARGQWTLGEGLALYGQRYHAAFDGAFRNARRLRRMLELPSAVRAALIALVKMPGVAEMVVRSTRSKALPNC